ncbi:MAG: hypothetical protein AAGC85_10275 [Bacteroidota bacterium]
MSWESDPSELKLYVILILTDDQGYRDLHIYGNASISIPNMDHLGIDGARLDKFYVSLVWAPTQ